MGLICGSFSKNTLGYRNSFTLVFLKSLKNFYFQNVMWNPNMNLFPSFRISHRNQVHINKLCVFFNVNFRIFNLVITYLTQCSMAKMVELTAPCLKSSSGRFGTSEIEFTTGVTKTSDLNYQTDAISMCWLTDKKLSMPS